MLSKQPAQRYASAEALAEDLRRWQEHEPIAARPVGQLERTAKWIRRRPTAAALAAVSMLLFCAALSGGFWYQRWQIWWAAEQARQETVQTTRQTYINQEVAAAVRQAEEQRQSLIVLLMDPLKVHVLLSDLSQWQQPLDRARAAATRAQKLADGDPELLDPQLAGRLRSLNAHLTADEQGLQLARQLDAIRQEAYLWTEGQFHILAAGPNYAAAFEKAGLSMESATASARAEQIRQSPARYALVAALDFWSQVTPASKGQEQLLTVARLADPDPWRDRVRDPKNWRDRQALEHLAATADVAGQTPQILLVLGELLRRQKGDPKPLLRQAVLAHPQDFWMYFTLAEHSKSPQERIGYYQAALAIRPQSTAALCNLGIALRQNKDLAGAMGCYKKVLQIDPRHLNVYQNLGGVLRDQNDVAGAIALFKKGLECDQKFLPLHNSLALALLAQNDVEGAIASCETALGINPNFAPVLNTLGLALEAKKDLPGAIKSFARAVKIDPKIAAVQYNLGRVLFLSKDLDGALPYYREAIALNPDFAEAHCNLGIVLRQKGQFTEALKELQIGHALGVQQPGWKDKSAQWVKQCEQLLALDRKLTEIQKGPIQPANAAEQLALAELCRIYKKQYVAATQFYVAAFSASAPLMTDLKKPNRYNAACGAVLAAAGQGSDAAALDAPARAKLRQQALEWLRADLVLWQAQAREPKVRETVLKKMTLWQADADLVSVRDRRALARLPEEERLDWQQLWADVGELLHKTKK